MAENVKVIVRCRPMSCKELECQSKPIIKMKDCMVEIFDPNEGPAFPKQFTFDSVYDSNAHTESIYNDICYPLVESVLEGYNSTIFVYGQTGCGKSFTMEGDKSSTSHLEKGVISRTFEHIFEAISLAKDTKYLVIVSYLEIYNEKIRDLLIDNASGNHLPLKETANDGLTVLGLTTHQVHNIAECEALLHLGAKNRMIGATLMNQNSSRSHSIFTVSIEQMSNANDNETIRKGKLNLVDLAGSERQAKTGATGERLKEATKINLSLSALGNVISALVDGKAKHIPYRDSKLTRLLQDSLGGNTRTLMIACVSPSGRNYVETLSTLRYANRAKNISNKPTVNEDPKDAILRQYQEEIERLKCVLKKHTASTLKNDDVDEESTTIEDDVANNNTAGLGNQNFDEMRDQIIVQYETEMAKLKDLHADEKAQKETIMGQVEAIREGYRKNIEKLNQEIKNQQTLNMTRRTTEEHVNKEEILRRIETLKATMIGGERANDKELSERRRRKKIASERRLSAIAHVLAKMDLHEDREILQNQYKDISQELNLKTDALRRFRYRVKSLEKEIQDISSEFETERQDYLETIRKQDLQAKLLNQIAEKIAGSLKNECNYRDLVAIREQAVWLDDLQMYKLPDMAHKRTKLPPAAGYQNRISPSTSDTSSGPTSPPDRILLQNTDDILTYFKPKRATQLLNQSARQSLGVDPSQVISTWRDYASTRRSQGPAEWVRRSPRRPNGSETNMRRPLRLEALPNIDKSKYT